MKFENQDLMSKKELFITNELYYQGLIIKFSERKKLKIGESAITVQVVGSSLSANNPKVDAREEFVKRLGLLGLNSENDIPIQSIDNRIFDFVFVKRVSKSKFEYSIVEINGSSHTNSSFMDIEKVVASDAVKYVHCKQMGISLMEVYCEYLSYDAIVEEIKCLFEKFK